MAEIQIPKRAYHFDGDRCRQAETTRDCPRQHDWCDIAAPVKHVDPARSTSSWEGRTYYTVICRTCLALLNSGHRYPADELESATACAERHNAEFHDGDTLRFSVQPVEVGSGR